MNKVIRERKIEKELTRNKNSKGPEQSKTYYCSYGFIGYDYSDQDLEILDSNSDSNPNKKRDFIRIFKDTVPESLWSSYCMGLGLDASDESLKSFKVYIDSPAEDVQADEYTIDGDLIN